MLVIRAGIYKMLVRIENREDPDHGLHCLSSRSALLIYAFFETFTIYTTKIESLPPLTVG